MRALDTLLLLSLLSTPAWGATVFADDFSSYAPGPLHHGVTPWRTQTHPSLWVGSIFKSGDAHAYQANATIDYRNYALLPHTLTSGVYEFSFELYRGDSNYGPGVYLGDTVTGNTLGLRFTLGGLAEISMTGPGVSTYASIGNTVNAWNEYRLTIDLGNKTVTGSRYLGGALMDSFGIGYTATYEPDRLDLIAHAAGSSGQNYGIDSIALSTVPEPNTLGVLLLFSAGFGLRRRIS